MLPSIPGKGPSKSVMKTAEKMVPRKNKNPKMDIIKKSMPAKKQTTMPLQKMKAAPMPLQKMKKIPSKTPEFMKPGYKPGSIMRGYTKYA